MEKNASASISLVEFVDTVWTHHKRAALSLPAHRLFSDMPERRWQFATALAVNYHEWFASFFVGQFKLNEQDDPRTALISGLSLVARSGIEMEDGTTVYDNEPRDPPSSGTRNRGKRAATTASSTPSKRFMRRGKEKAGPSSSAGLTREALRRHDERMSSASSDSSSAN